MRAAGLPPSSRLPTRAPSLASGSERFPASASSLWRSGQDARAEDLVFQAHFVGLPAREPRDRVAACRRRQRHPFAPFEEWVHERSPVQEPPFGLLARAPFDRQRALA